IQHLADLGGDQSFSANPHASLSGTEYRLQREMRDSKIVSRAQARGIKMWLGFYLSNYSPQVKTPLADWFDDNAWSKVVLPGVDLIDYGTYFPDGWNALVQQEINSAQRPYAKSVQINFWDGLTSVPGYDAIRFFDATFYKTPHLDGSTWDTALTYNANRTLA